ncbi:MAG: hypothetical protein ACTSSH_06000 [Candidatus Heimdallarchaeota archaeon]
MSKVHEYIQTEINNYETAKIPITGSVDWNMKDYIERCTNVSNGWYNEGQNDGKRPYKNIVEAIKNVALRSEGFDVKDIVPYVNDVKSHYLSFFVKKYHPQWAREHEIDTFIDEMVESSVIYDLALIKNVNEVRPQVIPLQQIAFCDQTDIMSGAICIKHQYTIPQLLEFKDKWNSDKIDEAIIMAEAERETQASNRKTKTPSKYIEVFELHGTFKKDWLEDDERDEYTPQMHIVCFYSSNDNEKHGITLYEGKDKKLEDVFKALVINKVFGRACGKSLIETLFDPQASVNYSEIKIMKMLDAVSVILLQTSSDELGNKRISNLKNNEILKHEDGKPITQIQHSAINMQSFVNKQTEAENDARIMGSASDAQLGTNPVSGTPFALQNLIVQQGQGIHEYRQGKIATFMSDVLYKDWILKSMVKEMNAGKDFSEELSVDEMQFVAERISKRKTREKMEEMKANKEIITEEKRDELLEKYKNEVSEGGNRMFFKIVKGELDKIPIKVFINIKGKQKYMAQNADKLTNIIREVMRNPQAFSQIPGIGQVFNELLENSGLNPIDFSKIVEPKQPQQPQQQIQQPNQINQK